MTAPLLALPYDPASVDIQYSVQILDTLVAHPQFFSMPGDPPTLRASAAAIMADARNLHWGVWRGEELLGMLSLTNVVEGLDARLHFLFFDRNLVGKRALLRQFLAHCFGPLGFRRLSAEVPEDAAKLIRFYRNMGFRYEGECALAHDARVQRLNDGRDGEQVVAYPEAWVAKQGSRIEKAFYRGGAWIDLLRLVLWPRLLAVSPTEARLRAGQHTAQEAHATTDHRRRRSPRRGGIDREGPRPEAGPDHHTAAS